MPNWASTNYYISGKDVEKVKNITDKINLVVESECWLGNILKELGCNEEVYSRGWIQDKCYYKEDNMLVLYCETAWGELTEWRDKLKELCDVKVKYTCEETGCGIYITNDESKLGYYILTDEDEAWFELGEEDRVCKYVSNFLNKEVKTIEQAKELSKKYYDEHISKDGSYIEINEYDFIDD